MRSSTKARNSLFYRGSILDTYIHENQPIKHNITEAQIQDLITTFQTHKQLTTDSIVREVLPYLSVIPYFQKTCPASVPLQSFIPLAVPGFLYEYVEAGKAVFHMGDRGDRFYIVLKGRAGVYLPKSEEQLDKELQDIAARKPLLGSIRSGTVDEKSFKAYYKKRDRHIVEDELALINVDRIEKYFAPNNQCLYKKVHVCGTFETFGDTALTTDKPRTASIVALTNLHLISLTKLEFRRISERQVQGMQAKLDFLQAIFPGVSKHIISKIVTYFKEIDFNANQIVWYENDATDCCILIRQGRVLISKTNVTINLMVETQKQLKYCILGEQNFVGEEDILQNRKLRDFTCETMNEPVKAYVISIDELFYLLKMFPDVSKKIHDRCQAKMIWLSERQHRIIQTNEKQHHIFNQIGKPLPKPPERIGVQELKQQFEEHVEHDDPRHPRIRSLNTKIIHPKATLIEHKLKLYDRHIRRGEELTGQKHTNFEFAATPEFEALKQRIANKFNQHRKPLEESVILNKRSISDHLILPIRIAKDFRKSLHPSVTGGPIDGPVSTSRKPSPPRTDRPQGYSVKHEPSLGGMFLTETIQLNNSTQNLVAPIHQNKKLLSSQIIKNRNPEKTTLHSKRTSLHEFQDSIVSGSQLKNL